jgi:hypothetical protein
MTNKTDNLTQKKAFKMLMPQIQNLREKGCSFKQIAELLRKIKFDLGDATVRAYYGEMIADFK